MGVSGDLARRYRLFRRRRAPEIHLGRHRDHIPAELQGKRLRHVNIPPTRTKILTGKESTELGQSRVGCGPTRWATRSGRGAALPGAG